MLFRVEVVCDEDCPILGPISDGPTPFFSSFFFVRFVRAHFIEP